MINNIDIKKTEEQITKIINSQDFNQKIWIIIYVIFELYRLFISTLLILFVPQNCNGQICTFVENLIPNNNFYIAGLFMNFFTLLSYIFLYGFEITREFKLVKYLDVNNSLPTDNNSVGNVVKKLYSNKMNLIHFLNSWYQKIGIFCCITFFVNTIISGIIINEYSLGNQTISGFITNILFMFTKIYHIYCLVNTDKNIFYSAYLLQKVQFNDLDSKIKKIIELKQNKIELNSLDINSLDVNSLDINSLDVNSLDVNSLDIN